MSPSSSSMLPQASNYLSFAGGGLRRSQDLGDEQHWGSSHRLRCCSAKMACSAPQELVGSFCMSTLQTVTSCIVAEASRSEHIKIYRQFIPCELFISSAHFSLWICEYECCGCR
uniref:Uncharacterized protein n=1 Tax=Zea mays TaxID=4577 RepID=A0A804QFI9_MAIZE